MEIDGSVIEDEEILPFMANETLLLLEPGQYWTSSVGDEAAQSTSTSYVLQSSDVNIIDSSGQKVLIIEPEPESICEKSATATSSNAPQMDHQNANGLSCNNEFKWVEFDTPWNKIPSNLISQCEKGTRVPQTITSIVHIIVDEMRAITEKIPSKAFNIQAQKVADKYPKMFRDFDEDKVVLGDGCSGIKQKLLDRHNYLNRPHKRPIKTNAKNPVVNKKSKMFAKAGCSNWNPPLNENATDEFEKLYPAQRQYINDESPNVNDLKMKWPEFWLKESIFWHFDKLTGSQIESLEKQVLEKYEKIFSFGEKKNLLRKIVIKEKQNVASNMFKQILYIFSAHFNEDIQTVANFEVNFLNRIIKYLYHFLISIFFRKIHQIHLSHQSILHPS